MVDFSSFGASILDFDCYKMIKDLLPYFLSVAEYHDFPDFSLIYWKWLYFGKFVLISSCNSGLMEMVFYEAKNNNYNAKSSKSRTLTMFFRSDSVPKETRYLMLSCPVKPIWKDPRLQLLRFFISIFLSWREGTFVQS